MVKLTIQQACTSYNILNEAKVAKMNNEDRVEMVKIMRVLKPVFTSYADFQKDIADKLKPSNFEPIEEKIKAQVPLSPEERLIFTKYDSECQKPTQEELDKEIELDFTPLSAEAMSRLLESNDFSMAQIMALYDTIGK